MAHVHRRYSRSSALARVVPIRQGMPPIAASANERESHDDGAACRWRRGRNE